MKYGIWILCLFSLTAFARSKPKTLTETIRDKAQLALSSPPADKEVCFSPDEQCDLRLIKFIQSAKQSLDVAIFDLTHVQIAHEIAAASKRIPVRVVCDRRQSKGEHSMIDILFKAGVPLKLGLQRGIMHNKFTIVDAKMVETGSFNYSDGATSKNNENQIYLADPNVVSRYRARFEEIWSAGKPYATRLSRKSPEE